LHASLASHCFSKSRAKQAQFAGFMTGHSNSCAPYLLGFYGKSEEFLANRNLLLDHEVGCILIAPLCSLRPSRNSGAKPPGAQIGEPFPDMRANPALVRWTYRHCSPHYFDGTPMKLTLNKQLGCHQIIMSVQFQARLKTVS